MDKLKEYIESHKEEFETDRPNQQVWSALEAKLDQKEVRHRGVMYFIPKILKVAATVFVLLSAGAGMGYYMQMQQSNDVSLAINNPDHRKEFKEAASYFTSQIDSKIAEVQSYKSTGAIIEELNQIDQVSAELKMEILKNPEQDQDLLVKEMMQQYQQKLNVLNKILTKLKENEKNQPSPSKETSSNHDTLHL